MFVKDKDTHATMWQPKAFSSYDAGEQPGESNSNEHATSQHGPVTEAVYKHDHAKGKHTVALTYSDGHKEESVHSSAAEAYEKGGLKAATNVKREDHPAQQGARSSERNYEQDDLV